MSARQMQNMNLGNETKVALNVWQIKTTKNVPFFKYDVKIVFDFGNEHTKELSTDRFDDARRLCSIIMAQVAKKQNLGEPVYNRASALYTLAKMEACEIRLSPSEIDEVNRDYSDLKQIIVNIKPADASFQASTNDLKSCLNALPGYQPNLLEVLNILLEREAFSKPATWYSKDAIHFQIEGGKDIGAGAIIKPGLKTSADVVGDSLDKLMLVVTADIKTVVHHQAMKLDAKLDLLKRSGLHPNNYIDAIQGVSVVPIYGKKKAPWTIQAVNQNIKITQNIDGQSIDNVTYFRKQYNINLTRKDLPMIGKRTQGRIIWFPAEVLQIIPHQAVTKERQLQCHHDTIVEFSSMLPSERFNLTKEFMTKLGLFNSESIKRFGFEILPQNLELKANILSSVRINNKPPRDNKSVNIRNEKYYRPPNFANWAIINYGCTPQTFQDFKKWIMDQMVLKGVDFKAQPGEITINSNLTSEEILKRCRDSNFRFVMIILDGKYKIHDDIKYYEREYQVITQIILANTVRKAVDKKQGVTIDNILLKTILKNGGIPYGPVELAQGNLKILSNEFLYIGITFSHMQTSGGSSRKFMRDPSRVGYAATCSFHPNQIIGDYLFVHPHDNDAAYNSIAQLVGQCKDTFIKNRSKPGAQAVPKVVVLYIRGYSESQWRIVETVMLPKLKQALSVPKKIQLILILENKHAMERLYRVQGRDARDPKEANVPAGLCLDHTIMNPLYRSFYLNPHVVLKGTARTAKFTVLVNEPNVDLASIENVTHAMSFLHSICTSPTGEPALLTIADACALRGQTILKYHKSINRITEISVEEANQRLTNPLEGRNHTIRYNA